MASWPFMLKSSHESVRRENGFLRDALKNANEELRKHRLLISQMRAGDPEITDKFMRARQSAKAAQS